MIIVHRNIIPITDGQHISAQNSRSLVNDPTDTLYLGAILPPNGHLTAAHTSIYRSGLKPERKIVACCLELKPYILVLRTRPAASHRLIGRGIVVGIGGLCRTICIMCQLDGSLMIIKGGLIVDAEGKIIACMIVIHRQIIDVPCSKGICGQFKGSLVYNRSDTFHFGPILPPQRHLRSSHITIYIPGTKPDIDKPVAGRELKPDVLIFSTTPATAHRLIRCCPEIGKLLICRAPVAYISKLPGTCFIVIIRTVIRADGEAAAYPVVINAYPVCVTNSE